MKAFNVTVYGKVQGVYFRASTREKALAFGLTGWCRNQQDGAVFIYVEGNSEKLTNFVTWCHKGPLMASVNKVEIDNVPVEGLSGFEIRY